VLSEGIDFSWESFGEYLDALDARPRTSDVGAQVPHAALRFYVMGERGADHTEVPTGDEIAEMGRLVVEALEAGALGFTRRAPPSTAPPTGATRRRSAPPTRS
jgi:N-acyl-D-amino-acid deacylase